MYIVYFLSHQHGSQAYKIFERKVYIAGMWGKGCIRYMAQTSKVARSWGQFFFGGGVQHGPNNYKDTKP
jgi:hypothetical protein